MVEHKIIDRRKKDRRKDAEAAKEHMGIEKRRNERRDGKPWPKKPGLPKHLP